MKVTTKGQVTIPQEIREELGIYPNTEVEFRRVGDAVEIRKAAGRPTRGETLVERLRGRGTVSMSTAEILALTRDDDDVPPSGSATSGRATKHTRRSR